MSAMIVADALTKIFEDRRRGPVAAADAVSFACPAGAVFGLLGPNGAGKTTTLRMLATLLTPTSGTARVLDFDVRRSPHDVRRCIGFLSGDTRLYDRLTPRETVRYFARLYGLDPPAIRARTDDLFDRFGLGAYADTLVQRLSTGTRQKISLARALVHDPPVLIVDEPTTGLDVLAARAVQDLLADCRRAGKTILLSTHAMAEAERLCDAVAVLHGGRILARGTPADVRARAGAATLEDAFFDLIRRAGPPEAPPSSAPA
jgi:sodium transport system ATP-binding protein